MSSWLMPDWEKTVVFIGQEILMSDKTVENQIGTGAIIQYNGIFYIVTCKHVIFEQKDNVRENVFVAFNSKTGGVVKRKLKDIEKVFKIRWFIHKDPRVDLVVIPFGFDIQNDDIATIPENVFLPYGEIETADDIFLLGYQPGLPYKKMKPIVRSGIISRVEGDNILYIDASVFPGNSGSPVLLRPSPIQLDKKNKSFNIGGAIHSGRLIGICSGYIPYEEIAISLQTGKPRIIFEENTGLSQVWSTDLIKEIFSQDEIKAEIERFSKENPEGKVVLENATST